MVKWPSKNFWTRLSMLLESSILATGQRRPIQTSWHGWAVVLLGSGHAILLIILH